MVVFRHCHCQDHHLQRSHRVCGKYNVNCRLGHFRSVTGLTLGLRREFKLSELGLICAYFGSLTLTVQTWPRREILGNSYRNLEALYLVSLNHLAFIRMLSVTQTEDGFYCTWSGILLPCTIPAPGVYSSLFVPYDTCIITFLRYYKIYKYKI